MKKYEQYMCAILSNPEWMKSVVDRYGSRGSVGMPELATAVSNLEAALATKFPEKEFDVESFVRDSEPPPK